jgi:colicin import membrane protein
MENRNGTPRAVVLAALLHLGIVAFLGFAIIPCTDYEKWAEALGVPAEWNPLKCPAPIQLPGQIIEATLVGPTGAPPPKHAAKPVPNTVPPPPAQPTPTPPEPEKKVETLPPPPKTPALKDQEKVVDDAVQKAENAKQLQEEQQRQRQAELDAQQEEKKKQKQKEIDEIFKQLDIAKSQTKQADSKKKQAEQQLKDLDTAKDDGREDLPYAEKVQSGQNGKDNSKQALYIAAIQNAVTPNWLHPDNMPNAPCQVHITQIPGGQVLSAKADSSCPYDAAGRASIENAVLRAQPLPYAGFEDVFQRNLTFTFRPQ